MKEGVVLEIYSSYVGVMTPEGEFLKVRKDASLCEVGEEIWFNESAIIYPGVKNFIKNYSLPKFALRSVAATAVMIVFFSTSIINYSHNSALGELLSFFDGRSEWENKRLVNRDTSPPQGDVVALSDPKKTEQNQFLDKESKQEQLVKLDAIDEVAVESGDEDTGLFKIRDDVEETTDKDVVNNNTTVAYSPVENADNNDNTSLDNGNIQVGNENNTDDETPVKKEPESDDSKESDSTNEVSPTLPSNGIDDEYVGSDTWGEDDENEEENGQLGSGNPIADDNDDSTSEEENTDDNNETIDEESTEDNSSNNEEDSVSACETNKECSCSKNGYYIEYETILTFEENEQGEIVEVYKEMPIKKYCEVEEPAQEPEEPQLPEEPTDTDTGTSVDNEANNSDELTPNTDETLLPASPSFEYDESTTSL